MNVDFIPIDDLRYPDWRATYILRPDLMVLAASIGEFGLLNPLIVQQDTNIVIDGSSRLAVISQIASLRDRFPTIPVIFVDVDESQSMVLHVQMNRGRGFIVPHRLSAIVRKLRRVCGFKETDFRDKFAIKFDELELLLEGSFIKHRNIKEHTYSKAWVPIEAPAGVVDKAPISIEKPPNPDN
jgi:hypothetical protein